ncbi:hypothetical protein BGZ74_003908 [Mortierella antarctica]|nr:hypothetical protein BGZ74_003908 [Mortierella antarctica]
MDTPPLSPLQLASISLAGSVENYSPIREMDGMSTTVAMDEQNEEAMSFLFQDMMRHSVSPLMAHTHALHPKVEADLTLSWNIDGYNPSHAQASVDREFGMGIHFDQGQADLIMGSVANSASLGNQERKSLQDHTQLQLQDHHSSSGERDYRQDSLETNPCYDGLSGLQIEQYAGEVVIGMGSQPILSNNTYDLFSSHSDPLFPCQQVVTDIAMTQAIVGHEMLNNTVNYDQFGNLTSTPTTYVNQDPVVYKGVVAPTAPLSAQFGFVNQLPEAVLAPDLNHSCLPHFQSMVRPYTPIETTAPFPTPCDNAPVFLHHPNAAPSYFPPMSSNEPIVAPSHGSSDMMMAPPQIAPPTMMNGRIASPLLFQSIGPVDPSAAMTMVPMHFAQSWPNMAHGPQIPSHELHQSLELINRLQALQQQQQLRQQDSMLNQGALYHQSKSEVDRLSGDSHPSTPQSTTTPLPDTTASTVPCATPKQFQHFPEGTVNMSAIHPSSFLHDKGSMSSPEKAQTPVDLDHSESADFEQDDKDGEADEEECVVESDDGDSSYHDYGNNASSSSYLDEEDEVDSDDDIPLRKKRTPSPLSSPSFEDSSEEAPKRRRHTTVRARRARTPYSSTETVPEAEQSSSTEAQNSRRRKPATKVRRARTPRAPELVGEAVEQTPYTEALVKSRKPRARRASTHTHHTEAKGVDEDDILLTVPAPNILEDGSIECTYLGCPRTFATMGLLRSHLVVHVDGKPYVCEMCDGAKRYKRNHDLLRHQREIHGEEEDQEDEREGDEVNEAADEGDNDMNSSDAPLRRCAKREEGSTRGGLQRSSSGRRHRKHRRTRVEHRMIWNGSEMEEIEVEMVRPRGRPRVRPLKDMPTADAYAFISSSSSSSMALTARPQAPSQNAEVAKRLHEWLRIEAQATAVWSTAEDSTDQSHTGNTGPCPPMFIPLVEESESNQPIKREEDELVMTGQWRALNARAADIQSQDSAYALHNLKEWLSAPEGSSPRSPGNMVKSIFNAPEAPASPTCNVAANVAAATERGVAAI